jgi:hypothetical protein
MLREDSVRFVHRWAGALGVATHVLSSRKPGTPRGQQLRRGPNPGFPARICSLCLRNSSRTQG